MLRFFMRGVVLAALALLLVPAGFSKSPAKSKARKAAKKAEDTTSTTSTDAKADETTSTESTSVSAPALPAQKAASSSKSLTDSDKPAPRFTPMLATTGHHRAVYRRDGGHFAQGRLRIFGVWEQIRPYAGQCHHI